MRLTSLCPKPRGPSVTPISELNVNLPLQPPSFQNIVQDMCALLVCAFFFHQNFYCHLMLNLEVLMGGGTFKWSLVVRVPFLWVYQWLSRDCIREWAIPRGVGLGNREAGSSKVRSWRTVGYPCRWKRGQWAHEMGGLSWTIGLAIALLFLPLQILDLHLPQPAFLLLLFLL